MAGSGETSVTFVAAFTEVEEAAVEVVEVVTKLRLVGYIASEVT